MCVSGSPRRGGKQVKKIIKIRAVERKNPLVSICKRCHSWAYMAHACSLLKIIKKNTALLETKVKIHFKSIRDPGQPGQIPSPFPRHHETTCVSRNRQGQRRKPRLGRPFNPLHPLFSSLCTNLPSLSISLSFSLFQKKAKPVAAESALLSPISSFNFQNAVGPAGPCMS